MKENILNLDLLFPDMKLFRLKQDKMNQLNENKFSKEIDIQKIVEGNLDQIFGLEFIKSEMSLNGLRIDTLAYNRESNSFVVVEYKKDRTFSLVDQGYAYLSLLLNNKAEFILEYNNIKNESKGKRDIDWSQSRVLFVSPQYTRYQRQAVNFRDLPFELWEIHRFERDTFVFNQIESAERSESITLVSRKDDLVEQISKEIVVYSEEEHVQNAPDAIRGLYEEFKEHVFDFGDDVDLKAVKLYVVFKAKSNFVSIVFQKSQLKLYLPVPIGSLTDPLNLARDVSDIGHWASGDYEIILKPESDMTYILLLVRQSYEENS